MWQLLGLEHPPSQQAFASGSSAKISDAFWVGRYLLQGRGRKGGGKVEAIIVTLIMGGVFAGFLVGLQALDIVGLPGLGWFGGEQRKSGLVAQPQQSATQGLGLGEGGDPVGLVCGLVKQLLAEFDQEAAGGTG
jgi:hypothetical protein